MRKRLSFLLFLLSLTGIGCYAQVVDIIVTRDGNRYEGYISKQVPGRELIISSLRTFMTVSQHDITLNRQHEVLLSKLPEDCQELFPELTEESAIKCADVSVTDKDGRITTFKDAIILESGEEFSFVSFDETDIVIEWDNIKVSAKHSPFSDPSREIYDKIILEDAVLLEGHYLGKNLRNGIVKFRETNGNVTTIRQAKIKGISHEITDPERDIWSLIPYLDRITLKNGSTLEGFIVSQLFGTSVSVQLRDSESTQIAYVKDIESYEKYPNPAYLPPSESNDAIVEEDASPWSVFIMNDSTYTLQKVNIQDGYYTIEENDESVGATVKVGKYATFKINVETRTSNIKVARIKMEGETSRKGAWFKRKNKLPALPHFTDEDWVTDCDMNFQSNDGHSVLVDMVFRKCGTYAIFIEDFNHCAVITVR